MNYIESKSVGTYIEFNTHELLFLSESGQPYRGQLFIQYMNQGKVIDLISLKKYIEQLRQRTILLEDISSVILQDINSVIENSTVCVTVKTTARGGISSTIRAGKEYNMPESKPIVFGV